MRARGLGMLLAGLLTTVLVPISPTGPAEAAAAPRHGSVVRTEPLAWTSSEYDTTRVTYWSTDASGRATKVTGALIKPVGPAPAGGWPVMAVAHTTTGILRPCAPSTSADLFGQVDIVNTFGRQGYAVAMTDYQGLGYDGADAPTGHPYLDNQTAARNVIDSVLAMRTVWPGAISDRWAAVGLSQGGGPAWSADELASSYGKGLRLAGAAAASPPSDMSGLVAKSLAGTMTPDQGPAMQWILASQTIVDPSFPVDRFRAPDVVRLWDRLIQCEPSKLADRYAALQELDPAWLKPEDRAATRLLTKRLQTMAVAKKPLSAPLFVVYGSADTLVDASWTTAALARQRQLGGDVRADLQQGRQHDQVDLSGLLGFLRTVLPPPRG